MPASMTHLMFAKRIKPQGSALFYLGSIAPDAMSGRKKDETHFRNLNDREPALINLAKNVRNDFDEGVLAHLYLDWKWDYAVIKEYIEKTGGGWFASYSNEISIASSYSFHNTGFAKQLFSEIVSVDIKSYGLTPGAAADEVRDYISGAYKWHNENKEGPSAIFSPEFIEVFISRTAQDYIDWIKRIER